jgi:hypothetical protein
LVKKILIDYFTPDNIEIRYRTKQDELNIKLIIYVYEVMGAYYENLAKIVITIIR